MKYSELTAIFDELKNIPPVFAVSPEREKILLRLDGIFGEPDSEISATLGRFYRERVDAALSEIKAYHGKTPCLWKFYSSGIIIRSARRTIAIDINDGCVPEQGRTAVTLRPAQIRALADIIDEYYCTHSHSDHISPSLCDALARRGKLIVMPAESIRRWMIHGAVPADKFCSEHCRVFMNWQESSSGKLDCAMYFFSLSNNRTAMVRGDIYHEKGFDACLAHLHQWGKSVDYVFLTPYFTGGVNPVEALGRNFACRFIPIHEWEFSHRGFGKKGAATQCYSELYKEFRFWYRHGYAQVLSWGESIFLT